VTLETRTPLPLPLVLIHSPLVGPAAWSLVADELRGRSVEAVVPSLLLRDEQDQPYWRRHVAAIVCALQSVPHEQPVVAVAHSGAGPLLPAVGQGTDRPVAGHVFVDAPLPGRDGQSRLDLFEPDDARRFREAARGGLIPPIWRNDNVLRAAGIEDASLRRRFAAEVPDVPLAVYEEPLPVPRGWPDAPCAYLRFSAPYEADGAAARGLGWVSRELPGGHFHMLADPAAVTQTLLDLVDEMSIARR
jgi:hypothetical protein